MNIEDLATKQDLAVLQAVLIRAMQEMVGSNTMSLEEKYLRTKEVRNLLGISSGTLANLRMKGVLNPSKIDGIYYYKLSEIKKLLNAGTE